MHSHNSSDSKDRPQFPPYFFASSISATIESMLFHPLDTVAKRLQHNPVRISIYSPQFSTQLKQAVLPNANTLRAAFVSLYQGIFVGIAYRILQRNIMFVGQPAANYILNKKSGPAIEHYFGPTLRGPLIASLAGWMTCIMEMPALFLDTVKVRMQNKHLDFMPAFKSGNLLDSMGITVTRNMIAATSLFGGAAFVRQMYGLNNPNDATLKQEWIASSFGATLATTLNNWADTIKTRVQSNNDGKSYKEIGSLIWKQEGVRGLFFRGLVPRLITVAPRTAFAMTAVNQIVKKVNAASEQGMFSRRKTLQQDKQIVSQEKIKRNGP